jgi:hypothetical protein
VIAILVLLGGADLGAAQDKAPAAQIARAKASDALRQKARGHTT